MCWKDWVALYRDLDKDNRICYIGSYNNIPIHKIAENWEITNNLLIFTELVAT